MPTQRAGKVCSVCTGMRMHEKQTPNNLIHIALCVVSGGLWLPFWALFMVAGAFGPWRCCTCGTKYRKKVA